MKSDHLQYILIGSGIVATALFGVFFYRELFPEYKIYQNAYVELEEFRSSYTGQPPPPFKGGVKQIVLENKDNGPVEIDRCTSCHVTLQFEHFSPTRLAKDINGNIIYDSEGIPVKEDNPNYVWAKLDEKIAELSNPESSSFNQNKADTLKKLKTAHVGEHEYSMAKALQMHPLIGKETRPFEYHPIDEYGCTSCHGGNGRGLTTEKAHGPVFDGQYEEADMGPVPQFTEPDPDNDPKFSKIFNAKPGHQLLFQTTPILVGALMESKCLQCHQTSKQIIQKAKDQGGTVINQLKQNQESLKKTYEQDLNSIVNLLDLRVSVLNIGVRETVEQLKLKASDYRLNQEERELVSKQALLLTAMVGGEDGLRIENAQPAQDVALKKLKGLINNRIGSEQLTDELIRTIGKEAVDLGSRVQQFVEKNRNNPQASGEIFKKMENLNFHENLFQKLGNNQQAFEDAIAETKNLPVNSIQIDRLTKNYQQGERLFLSQGCYPCHRIAGFSRGGVGPELTQIGNYYPWFIKESIVWPQADLKTSTMPNFKLDHEELEDLVTFLLAQKGQSKAISDSDYKSYIADWESGKKMPWEKPVTPADMHNLDYSMTIFATEGCASCHRLKGYKSNVGFKIEKDNPEFKNLYQEREWFRRTVPEMVSGSDLVRILEKFQHEIDDKIVNGIRQDSLLEKIDQQFPGNTESFYSNFAYAKRAKNTEYHDHPEKLKAWKERVHRVLMMYVQEYGLGRLIGPRPNWSGVYRTDEWLMEHFRKPSALVARSIMPVFPFDETKFYALTYMLDVLGAENRDENHKIWENRGFNPETAYELYCSQCHGSQRIGNGPISEWIYPVPKNLRNADFMQNLTPERAKYSIVHGVKGGPMAPWGEAPMKAVTGGKPVLSEQEIEQLVNWLYTGLPGSAIYKTKEITPKWKYGPEDVLKELEKEGTQLPEPLSVLPKGTGYYASIDPKVVQIFDVVENQPGDPDQESYYIKKKYYTEKNLNAGKTYFELHCAVCHGRDADGAGQRAGVMLDAKPRMLTNLDWLHTRDDMRLLRSIKYGVTGTSMQPWGDQTSSLQRLQLVMYIRSLSEEQDFRDQLYKALYQSFDQEKMVIDEARISRYPKYTALQQKLDLVKEQQKKEAVLALQSKGNASKAAELYQEQLKLTAQLNQLKKVEELFTQLKRSVEKEKTLYEEIGLGIISIDPQLLEPYISIIKSNDATFEFKNQTLKFKLDGEDSDFKQLIEKSLEEKIGSTDSEKTKILGKINSVQRQKELTEINQKLDALKKLKLNLLSGIEESKRLKEEQNNLVKQLNEIK